MPAPPEVTRRGWDDFGGEVGAAEVDLDRGAFLDVRREEGEGDALAQHGREVAAGDHAGGLAVDQHRTAVAGRPAAFHQQPPQPPRHASLALGLERRPAAEGPLLPADHPTQTGLERRDPGAELVAVQRQAGLEPQRVRAPSPAGSNPAASTTSQTPPAASAGTATSTPSSPV